MKRRACRNIPTLHIMLHGDFKDLESYAHKVAHGFRQTISPKLPLGVRSLIERCWQGDPKMRPSMAEVAVLLEELQPPGGLLAVIEKAFQVGKGDLQWMGSK